MTQTIIGAMIVGCGIISAIHALMTKRDPRSTLGWTILCLLVPGAGAALYWIFGVNRIQTKARRWQERGRFTLSSERSYGGAETPLGRVHPVHAETMNALVRISERVTRRPLLAGNQVEPLYDGEDAYPAMLAAIEAAQISIYLTTYIFDTDEAGMRFIEALGAAADRGVDVRVIVDGIGECYARPRCSTVLRKRHKKVKIARFLPPALSLRGIRINLRTHRKLLTVDSTIGFTGGMNIGQRHMVTDPANKHVTQDLHFRVVGPVVLALEEIFFEDWLFVTGEEHTRGAPANAGVPAGDALCRAISDGPNEDFEVLTWILVGALSTARKRVQIMTPYFIPSRELLSALNAAALRGVMVQIILPRWSNLPFVAWATQAMLDEVMQYGIQIYYQPEPFNHTKLFVVDEFYTVIGSANLDPRSLRLNFELNVEVYDPSLSERLSQRFDEVRARSHLITPDELYQRNPLLKLRDSLAKLLSPYL